MTYYGPNAGHFVQLRSASSFGPKMFWSPKNPLPSRLQLIDSRDLSLPSMSGFYTLLFNTNYANGRQYDSSSKYTLRVNYNYTVGVFYAWD